MLGSRHGGGLYYVDGLAMYVGYETYTSGVHIAAVNISCMLQTPELTAAIENSYRTFAVYPLRTDTGPCSCCHSRKTITAFARNLLRMLGPKDLRTYAYDALYTWGDEVDFRHFLPRIMELLAQANGDGPAFVDPESVFHKLSYQSSCSSGWRTWPPEEQRAIADYTLALWGALLDSEPTELSDSAFSWLCAFAQAADDLSPYLQQWMAASSANAHRNLATRSCGKGCRIRPVRGAVTGSNIKNSGVRSLIGCAHQQFVRSLGMRWRDGRTRPSQGSSSKLPFCFPEHVQTERPHIVTLLAADHQAINTDGWRRN